MTKNKVELRLIFVKIGQVDTVNERYSADVFLQAKWREPELDGKSDALVSGREAYNSQITSADLDKHWSPSLYVENLIAAAKEILSKEVIYEGDQFQEAYIVEKRRMKGLFLEILELKHFPFDCQDLSVTVSTDMSSEELELTENPIDISRVNEHSPVDSQEWDLHNHVDVLIEEVHNDCNVGPRVRPSMQFTTRVSRRFPYFAINNILLSVILTLLSFFAFAVPQGNPFGRLQLSFILLLTTVTFKSAASQHLPKIPYLTCLDKLILGNMCMIVLACIWHASISLMMDTSVNGSVTILSLSPNSTSFARNEPFIIAGLGGLYCLFLTAYLMSIYFDAGTRRRQMHKKDREFKARLDIIKSSLANGESTKL